MHINSSKLVQQSISTLLLQNLLNSLSIINIIFFANNLIVFISNVCLYTFIIEKERERDRGRITFILFITAVELNLTQMTVGTLRAARFVVVIW